MDLKLVTAVFLQLLLTGCQASQKVVLILFDGFRHDYSLEGLGGFQNIVRNGVKASSLQPVFPSLSFPNYYSIATGLYAESHGVIHNYIYDPTEDKEFLIGTVESDFDSFWWKDGEPVWISAEKQGKKAVMYYWPGCEARIQERLPSVCVRYDGVPSLQNLSYAFNETIKELAHNDAEFAAIYYESVDKYGHLHGPGSPEVATVLRDIDGEIKRLLAALETTNMADGSGRLSEVVNVMIVSDHGMASVQPDQRIVLSDIVDQNNLERALPSNASDVVVQLWPKEGQLDLIYQALSSTPGLKPYKKLELLDRWHLKNNDRVPPITVVADQQSLLLSPTYEGDPSKYQWYKGFHGYDNNIEDMGGIFMAVGPAFKSNWKTEELECIELYQIMCRILDVPAAPHNGTWKNIEDLLATDFNGARHTQSNLVEGLHGEL